MQTRADRRKPLWRTARAGAMTAVVIWLLTVGIAGQPEFPAPVGKVNDFASMLPLEDRERLETQLADLERETSAEVAVVTLRSLEGRSVEEYANALFQEWGIGKAGRDNGVLILVARDDREIRIEVGYGLEGVLPDGLAGAIIRETFTPPFQAGDYPGGIRDGTTRVADIIRRNETLTAEQRAALDRAAAQAGQSWIFAAFLSLFVAVGAFGVGSGAAARVLTPIFAGLLFMVVALFMALVTSPPNAVAALVAFAVVLIVVGYRLGQRPTWRRSMRGTGKGAGGSGWLIGGGGGGSSGGSSSGGSSSSSSSFGGGSSGGGGASGRW